MNESNPPTRGAVLGVHDLVVVYGTQTAVNGVSFQIERGEIFGLLGPNGAGKTSTLSAIEGLVKPRSGTATVDGFDVQTDPAEAKARMGVQLQASSFQAELTIEQIVQLYAGLYGMRIGRQGVEDQIRAVGLAGELGKRFKSISGGQQQRLSLLIAVIHKPVLLLLDEPTSGLDPQSRRQLWDRIERLRVDGGSILLTTHSMEEAQAVCDRVAIIDHGTLVAVDTPVNLIETHRKDPRVLAVARGKVTLEDVFIGLTGSDIRD
jgi:ABC-2 type transport system ATP-binding protein